MRAEIENREKQWLSERAMCAIDSKGRQTDELPCPYRTCFQRDRDRIIHSKAFRRLKHKTQVFLSPEGDHYRTRLTHTLEVAQLSRSIARALYLNEDLSEAVALAHDLGHTPFGHCGEEVLNDIHKNGFKHREQSLRVVDFLENRRGSTHGLNLSYEVRDGILNHSGPDEPITLEGQIVRLCDRIAYINHDIDDALRAGVIKIDEVPQSFISYFGDYSSQRINKMINDVIVNSEGNTRIRMSEDAWQNMQEIRNFMFKRVYLNSDAKSEEEKASGVVKFLYFYYLAKPHLMPQDYQQLYETEREDAVKDFIAGMTDRYAVNLFADLTVPKYWNGG